MKKVYVKPETQSFEVEIQGVIAQMSDGTVNCNDEDASEEFVSLSDRRKSWGSLW